MDAKARRVRTRARTKTRTTTEDEDEHEDEDEDDDEEDDEEDDDKDEEDEESTEELVQVRTHQQIGVLAAPLTLFALLQSCVSLAAMATIAYSPRTLFVNANATFWPLSFRHHCPKRPKQGTVLALQARELGEAFPAAR